MSGGSGSGAAAPLVAEEHRVGGAPDDLWGRDLAKLTWRASRGGDAELPHPEQTTVAEWLRLLLKQNKLLRDDPAAAASWDPAKADADDSDSQVLVAAWVKSSKLAGIDDAELVSAARDPERCTLSVMAWLRRCLSKQPTGPVELVLETRKDRRDHLEHAEGLLRGVEAAAELDPEDPKNDKEQFDEPANKLQFDTWGGYATTCAPAFIAADGPRRVVQALNADYGGSAHRHGAEHLWCVFDWTCVRPSWVQAWIEAGVATPFARHLVRTVTDKSYNETCGDEVAIERVFSPLYREALAQLAACEGVGDHSDTILAGRNKKYAAIVHHVRELQPRVKAARA